MDDINDVAYAVVVGALAEWAGDYWTEDPSKREGGPSADVLNALADRGFVIEQRVS